MDSIYIVRAVNAKMLVGQLLRGSSGLLRGFSNLLRGLSGLLGGFSGPLRGPSRACGAYQEMHHQGGLL